MKLPLDTHALLWWLADDDELGDAARDSGAAVREIASGHNVPREHDFEAGGMTIVDRHHIWRLRRKVSG